MQDIEKTRATNRRKAMRFYYRHKEECQRKHREWYARYRKEHSEEYRAAKKQAWARHKARLAAGYVPVPHKVVNEPPRIFKEPPITYDSQGRPLGQSYAQLLERYKIKLLQLPEEDLELEE